MRKAVVGSLSLLAAAQVGPAATWLPPVRDLFPRLAGRGSPDGVALTFDDGPHPEGTIAVLDELERLHWPATFFMIGEEMRRYPDIVREVQRRGHVIAVHGDQHRYAIARTPRDVAEDLRRARDSVAELTGSMPRQWRPPYGVLSGPALLAANTLGLRPLLWTTWGRDWRADATAETVVADVRRGGLGGATVLLHDSDSTSAAGAWKTTVAALPLLADAIAAAGLRVRTLDQHLQP
jgi:peptidoglycan/xylan/chitin deacetylase (PgdA/CDA1 family)